MRIPTNVIDKNGKMIHLGDTVRTFDKKGKEWVGTIVEVYQGKVVKGANPQFALKTNYETWLHPEQGHLYEVI